MSMMRNEDLKNRHNLSIQNRYEILAIEDGFQLTEERQIKNQWKFLKDNIVSVAKEVLPCKRKETKQSWLTKDILEKIRERKKVKSNDQAKYNIIEKEIETDCRRAKDEWWHTKCEEVETLQSQHRTREIHEKIKEVTGQGHKHKGSNCIKDKKWEYAIWWEWDQKDMGGMCYNTIQWHQRKPTGCDEWWRWSDNAFRGWESHQRPERWESTRKRWHHCRNDKSSGPTVPYPPYT